MKKTNDPDELVSSSRMRNVRAPFGAIWDFINEEFELKLDPPFKGINAYITTITRGKSVDAKNLDDTDLKKFEEMLDDDTTKKRRPLDFVDYQAILNAYDNRRMRLATELMFLTGMIPSEIGGLLPKAVNGPYIKVRFTMVRGKLVSYPKNDHRIRDIRITK